MPCGGCGKKTVRISRSTTMSDAVRLEYTGINTGSIPFRGVSGQTYKGSAKTHRFADVLPEDVQTLVNSGKWRVQVRDNQAVDEILPDVSDLQEPKIEPVADVKIDLSTKKTVDESLNEGPDFATIEAALEKELGRDPKPRDTVIKVLDNALKNHPDNPSNL